MNTRRVFVVTVCMAYGYYIMSTDGVRTGNICIDDLTKAFTVQLQCSVNERIHVVHEVYGERDAATCRLKSAEACSKLLASSQSGLVVSCNGKQSCREVVQVRHINNCNITDAAAEVQYNCIKGSMNMCSSVTTTVSGSVYLHSPGFPDSVGVNSSCVVRITGQNITVALVEQRIRSGVLNISGDGRQLWTNVNLNQYNRVLPRTAAEIVIVYKNHDQNGSNLWIKVADLGQMNITVNGEILDPSTTTTSTQQPSRSQSASDTPTTETAARAQSTAIGNNGDVVTALSVVCGILVLIIVVLVIYVMMVKQSRNSSSTGTSVHYAVRSSPSNGPQLDDGLAHPSATINTNSSLSRHENANVYDGIQRNTSDAGDEHNYGHITSSGGPFYVNSVSGGDPYVNI